MKKKIPVILLAGLMACSFFSACREAGQQSSGTAGNDERNYGSTVEATDAEQHLVSSEKTLHRKTITSSDRVFVTNGVTEYVIVVGTKSDSAYKAADFISKQVGACTGAYPRLLVDSEGKTEWNDQSKYIVISSPSLENMANVQWATDVELGFSGYMIKSVGDSVFMKVNSDFGYQQVALSFCREVLGYEWYSEDTIVYTKDGKTLPNMDIVEKPDFDLVDRSGYISTGGKFGSGMTDDTIFTYPGGRSFVHNSFVYLPPTTYNDATKADTYHPEWYAYEAEAIPTQLCYSAHGIQSEYDQMLQTAFESFMLWLEEDPDASTVTFTREDAPGDCVCDTCKAITSEYGSITATFMFFVNDLDDLVQKRLQEIADETGEPKREITILFFAYSSAVEPPVFGEDKSNYVIPTTETTTDKSGKDRITFTQVDSAGSEKTYVLPYNRTYENGLKCNEHVGVFYAPIKAIFTESFYHDANKEYRIILEKWGLLTERMYAWIYDTNFYHWIAPYNTFDSIAETLRFLKDNNCQYIFNQAQGTCKYGTNSVTTGFGMLKTYLNMTLPRDVNQNSEELTDKFFENYFRDAAGPMREYYDSLVLHMQQLEIQYPSVFYNGGLYTTVVDAKYWPLAKLQNWMKLCDDAYAAIEKYKTIDPNLYEVLAKHIKIETLFPRFMYCEHYEAYFENMKLQEMRETFYLDCKELNYQCYSEHKALSDYFKEWGLA